MDRPWLPLVIAAVSAAGAIIGGNKNKQAAKITAGAVKTQAAADLEAERIRAKTEADKLAYAKSQGTPLEPSSGAAPFTSSPYFIPILVGGIGLTVLLVAVRR